jgi:hypothetical protein
MTKTELLKSLVDKYCLKYNAEENKQITAFDYFVVIYDVNELPCGTLRLEGSELVLLWFDHPPARRCDLDNPRTNDSLLEIFFTRSDEYDFR